MHDDKYITLSFVVLLKRANSSQSIPEGIQLFQWRLSICKLREAFVFCFSFQFSFFCSKPGTWCKLPSFENIFYRRSSTILHVILYYAIDPQQKSIQKQAFEQQLLIKNPQPKQTRPRPRCHMHILQEKKFLYLCRNCSVRFKSETLVRSL